jgi:hypothetical protein
MAAESRFSAIWSPVADPSVMCEKCGKPMARGALALYVTKPPSTIVGLILNKPFCSIECVESWAVQGALDEEVAAKNYSAPTPGLAQERAARKGGYEALATWAMAKRAEFKR